MQTLVTTPHPPAHAQRNDAATTGGVQPARVVYFIASHVNPDQIVRLVRACLSGSPNARVLLHHDHRVSTLDRKRLEGFGQIDYLEPDVNEKLWGAFGMCRMVSRCLNWLCDNREFDWVVYLSGQDYPTQPIKQIEDFLTHTPHGGFIDAMPIEQRSWIIGQQRYAYQYYKLPQFKGWERLRRRMKRRSDAAVMRGDVPRILIPQEPERGFRVGWKPIVTPFRNGYTCWMGSSWWTLHRRSIEYMLDVAERRPELTKYFERVQFAPNEAFFLTLLANNPDLNLVTNDNKRSVVWTHAKTGHPDTMLVEDFDRLITCGNHFGRKFDSRVDGKVLDMIDERLGLSHINA